MGEVLVAMSGGVDSSVAAARLLAAGHRVRGVTMKLWGGDSDTGCCSVSDVDDARRVAQQLDIDHHVFNFGDDFTRDVVDPYVRAHASGDTPNPCIECNRRLKFDRLLRRAEALGFDAVATGHHARVAKGPDGTRRIRRAVDHEKDQSYVLYMLGQAQLDKVLLPIGALTKAEVRAEAQALGLRTADKPDSQDVCFITNERGREAFLADRIPLHRGRLVDVAGTEVGAVDAVELVTVGQRKGLGVSGRSEPLYALDVDVASRTVTVGVQRSRLADQVEVRDVMWADAPVDGRVLAQCSAHGRPAAADLSLVGDGVIIVQWIEPRARVAPGQSVVFYDGDEVVGGGVAR